MLKIAASSSLLFGEPRIIFLMRLLSSGLRAWWQEVGVDSGRPAFRARLPPPGAARGVSGEGLAGEGGLPESVQWRWHLLPRLPPGQSHTQGTPLA